jgi:hypothetical protein
MYAESLPDPKSTMPGPFIYEVFDQKQGIIAAKLLRQK